MSVVETERLLLRPLRGDDVDDYAATLADPDVHIYGQSRPA